MSKTTRHRYIPPAETVRDNRRAKRARALSIARAERNYTRAEIMNYRMGVA